MTSEVSVRRVVAAFVVGEMLGDVMTDATYVASHPAQFDPETQARAAADHVRAKSAQSVVRTLAREAYGAFRNTGATSALFDGDNPALAEVPPHFLTYNQLEPTP